MHVNIDRVISTVARNLGLTDFSKFINNFIEWAYEAEKLIGSRDTFVQEECTYSASGAQATGTITFAANPVSGDSITLNGVKLYFRSSTDVGGAKSTNEILLANGLARTLDNTTFPHGLNQSLRGFKDVSAETGTYANSAIYNYPEALNIAHYSISYNTNSEILTNGSFTGSPTPWTLGTGISMGTDSIVFSGVNQFEKLNQAITGSDFVEGDSYEVSFTVSGYSGSGSIGGNFTNNVGKGISISSVSANGTYTTQHVVGEQNFTTPSLYNRFWLQVTTTAVFTGVIDNVSLKKISTAALNITSKEIGDKGNKYTLSSDSSNANVSGLSLTGGKGILRNQQLTLPENNVKLLGVRVGVTSSQDKHYELRRSSGPHKQRVGKNDDESKQTAFRYYVNGNRLNIQHDSLDEITISYLAYPVDLRGWPKIKEGHETAVAQYIMWQMKLIEFYNGQLPQYITKELEKRWYYLCGKARGDDGMPTSDELKQIGSMWNTLLPIKSSNGLINL